ncbi:MULTISPECIES: hypothetical protein [unclassified Streptomyces]|uniref:hypothetical protein n=1 Tax=unclassified Streptomyces TaxID=2593676 RepID=UPI00039BA154|nr:MULTISPECIES: hypothetical protein [unclassified Streptomyces]MYX36004.1 hypothetical protein [Streptomyces sp. SID8377]
MNEVTFWEDVAETVESGTAANVATMYRQLAAMALAKREENARRREVRPHSKLPDPPEYLHIVLDDGDPEGGARMWRLNFEAVSGWSHREFNLAPAPA